MTIVLFILVAATSCSAQLAIYEPQESNSSFLGNDTVVYKTLSLDSLLPVPRSLHNNLFSDPGCTTADNSTEIRNITTRSGIPGQHYRWKFFDVYIDPTCSEPERNVISNAMYRLQEVLPCVRFGIYPIGSIPGGDYIRIVKGQNNGCDSHIGRIGGEQIMNLQSPGCMYESIILHEMVHALGFTHEHNRYDRDEFVTVHWDNIKSGYEPNFQKRPYEWATYGVPYDRFSIVHYTRWTFSTSFRDTLTAKDGERFGSRGVLTEYDKQKLKAMYNC